MPAKSTRRVPAAVNPNAFEAALEAMTPEQRKALGRLREQIKAVVPNAEECICYGVPGFRLNGKFLVGMGANAEGCSFYPGAAVQAFGDLLKGYSTGRGTVRFTPAKPLPATLVRKLVKARLALGGFEAKAKAKKASTTAKPGPKAATRKNARRAKA